MIDGLWSCGRGGNADVGRPVVVAIPANNEIERIETCLAALAVQRDLIGAPLPIGSFEILVFANNCSDGTAEFVTAWSRGSPHRVEVVAETLNPEQSDAGWARKRAMDLAAERLLEAGHYDGLIVTTDADSVVGPTWIDATWRAMADGVDCVAGYIDANPAEITRLGRAFVDRSRLEDRYLRAIAEIHALCDPQAHDPWPNHRVSSGASLAVTLSAYLSVGGLPPKPAGEDLAFTAALAEAGFKIRHSMNVCVSTSCRFDGRANGGAGDTMRRRHADLEAPCDEDLGPAFALVRSALIKGRLRRSYNSCHSDGVDWACKLGLSAATIDDLATDCGLSFEAFWSRLVAASPMLSRRWLLRPADLPHEIERATMCLRVLRRAVSGGRQAVEPIGPPVEDHVNWQPLAYRRSEQVARLCAGEGIVGLAQPMTDHDFAVGRKRRFASGGETVKVGNVEIIDDL